MSYASVSSITRSAGALSHHGDHLQGRQDNASLSPSRPFWPSQLLWPPRHSPLFGGRLETSISRNLPTVRAQGPEVCRAHPPSPSTRGSLPLPRCISVLPPPAPRHAPSRASERPLGPLYLSAINHPMLPLNHGIRLAWLAESCPREGEGEAHTPPAPLRGPFPRGQPAFSFVPRAAPLWEESGPDPGTVAPILRPLLVNQTPGVQGHK